MQYYVVMPSGERFGPATLPQLNQWIQEGRVLMTTTLQNTTTGQVILARDVPGLVWTPQPQAQPMVDPYSSSPYGQGSYGSNPYGSAQPGYGQQSQPGPFSQYQGQFPNPMMNRGGDTAAKTSLSLSLASFLCCPIVAPLALYYGYQAKAQGARNASTALTIAWIINIIFVLSLLSMFGGVFRMR